MFLSPKPKDRKKPLLTMTDVSQAFAVYPERPELISRSTLIKVEGYFGGEDTAAGMKNREGWLLVMPELEGGLSQTAEMLRWVTALHDAFNLYGRPQAWSWDPRQRHSLMFAYPVGPQKDQLFLDREAAESLDPRDDRTSGIRMHLQDLLQDKMRGKELPSGQQQQQMPRQQPGSLPQINTNPSGTHISPQLPPLSFGSSPTNETPDRRTLTPITETSSMYAHTLSGVDSQRKSGGSIPVTVQEEYAQPQPTSGSILGGATSESPYAKSASPLSPDTSASFRSGPGDNSFESYAPRLVTNAGRTSLDSGHHDEPLPLRNGLSSPSPPQSLNNLTPDMQRSHSIGSRLTSPYSMNESNEGEQNISGLPVASNTAPGPIPDQLVPPPPEAPRPMSMDHGLSSEAGALYYMQLSGDPNQPSQSPDNVTHSRRMPTTIPEGEDEDDDSTSESGKPSVANHRSDTTSTSPSLGQISPEPLRRKGTPMGFPTASPPPPSSPDTLASSPSRSGPTLARKPSGARAPTSPVRTYTGDSALSSHPESEPATMDSSSIHAGPSIPEDPDIDALAALSYLATSDDPPPPPMKPVQPLRVNHEHREPTPPSPPPADVGQQYKSSFAPSKHAAERKAKAQASQAAQQAAAHRPGRANGRQKAKAAGGAWGESSDEEEEEEEEEEGDSDDEELAAKLKPRQGSSNSSHQQSSDPQVVPPTPSSVDHPSHLRPPRNLPQIPGLRPSPASEEYHMGNQRREPPGQFDARRTHYDDGPQIRSQADFPQPGAARQTMWSQVLEQGPPEQSQGRDTFVQLEPPSQTMTKAFLPQGLLSAGLQDKQDRSAKRQEELAREAGASLINVPNKPPPPQTGLLGAITAHERERKREGGVGAALTEREREKRIAEERQRRFDDQQRQQMDQMQQGGSMFGGGYNPMMNPMMMGMNPMMPMMTGGGMSGGGMNPMMTGNPMMGGYPMFNPQHMFAAQQAAQAYQQAMMAFSVAGSQVGGEGGNGGGGSHGGTPQPQNPMMSGNGSMMFDPRMSMMGMPMMGMPMQMTGMSMPGFNPYASGGGLPQTNDSGFLPPMGNFGGSSGNTPARQASPAPRHGSPLARASPPAAEGGN